MTTLTGASAKMVKATPGWLERIVVSLGFGVWLLTRGMTDLLAYGGAPDIAAN
jgi:hypothetical protein